MDQRFQEINKQLEEIRNRASTSVSSVVRSKPPFTARILQAAIPANFKVPTMETYDGSEDPQDHVENFQTQMLLRQASDSILCRVFPSTLKGVARHWYHGLKPDSINSFDELVHSFVNHFVSSQKRRRTSDYLVSIKQREDEPLRSYLTRFNAAILEVRDLDHAVAMTALKSGLKECPLRFSLKKTYPKSWSEMLARAEKYANAEDESDTTPKGKRLRGEVKSESSRSARSARSARELRGAAPQHSRRRSPLRNQRNRSPPRRQADDARQRRFDAYTPLNTTREAILMQVGARLPEPPKIRTLADQRRNPNQYCEYHRDYGHNTEDCIQLEDEIEKFIREGGLAYFVQGRAPPRRFQQGRPPRYQRPRPQQAFHRPRRPYAPPPQPPTAEPALQPNPVANPAEPPVPEA